jgi:alpha-D-glucose phosphate-specific phosphoglucomutase
MLAAVEYLKFTSNTRHEPTGVNANTMKPSPIHFGTDGWRAVIADTYTFDNVRAVAGALAAYLHQRDGAKVGAGVAIGYDTRFLSVEFARAAAETIAATGIPVYLSERDCATPAIAWAVRSRGLSAGVMITASHNPPRWNGFKFFMPSGRSADKDATHSVEALLGKKVKMARGAAAITTFDARPDFLAQLRRVIDFDLLKKAKGSVVCDFVHGVGRGLLDEALRECGWRVQTIRALPDPMFGGILPDPADPACHKMLQEAVLKNKSDLGLANDPDADRFGVVDSTGQYITPNQVLSLLYVHLLEHRGLSGRMARTVATTHLLDAIAKKHRQPAPLELPVGFKWVGEAIDSGQVIFGGEESGGLSMTGHAPNKDGVLADLLIAEVWALHRQPLSEVYAKLMKKYGAFHSSYINLHVDGAAKDALMSRLRGAPPKAFAGVAVANVVTLDGIKLNLEDGSWLLMRPSGTEPIVRIYMEARTKSRLKELEKAAAGLSAS